MIDWEMSAPFVLKPRIVLLNRVFADRYSSMLYGITEWRLDGGELHCPTRFCRLHVFIPFLHDERRVALLRPIFAFREETAMGNLDCIRAPF